MNRVFSLIFVCCYLMGCNDKDSSELDIDSELRLEVSINHSVSDGDFATNHKNSTIEIRLFEDRYEKLKLLKANQHIVVKNTGSFLLDIDGVQYDLSEYYRSSGTLISDVKGRYRIDLNDHLENIQQLSISFTFDGGTYTADINVPNGVVVNNVTHELTNYNPLVEDVQIDWANLSLPARIQSSQIVFIAGVNQRCASEYIQYDILEDETSYRLSPHSYVFACYDNTQVVETVKSSIEIIQEEIDVESDSYGFQNVLATYEQTYFWSSEDDL